MPRPPITTSWPEPVVILSLPTVAPAASSGDSSQGGADEDTGPGVAPECVSAADCTDGDDCTDDLCTAGACSNPPNTASCDDGDPCTVQDACAAGSCAGTALDCNDANNCTVDLCLLGTCHHNASEEETCRLRIEVTSPTRGAVVTDDPTLGVKGTVISGDQTFHPGDFFLVPSHATDSVRNLTSVENGAEVLLTWLPQAA